MKLLSNGSYLLKHPIRQTGCCAVCICQQPIVLHQRRTIAVASYTARPRCRGERRFSHAREQGALRSVSNSLHDVTRALSSRTYASKASSTPDVAILGGGITGLATTFFLAEKLPNARITIYDGQKQLGGWLRSKAVDVGEGEVIFESGPRSLRPQPPNGYLTLDLARKLGLEDDMLFVPRNAPAAQNRYIYYPDRLVKMPGPGQSALSIFRALLTEPIFKGTFSLIGQEYLKEKRLLSLRDESVGEFVTRRFNANIANNLVSALYHGIYAGDIWNLSARTLLSTQWMAEEKYGGLLKGSLSTIFNQTYWVPCDDLLAEIRQKETAQQWSLPMGQKVSTCSVFTFREGVGMLAEALERKLHDAENVVLMKNTRVSALSSKTDSSDITIESAKAASSSGTEANSEAKQYTHVISTINPSILHSISKPNDSPSKLYSNLLGTHATTVSVVNLYFSTPNLLLKSRPPRTAARNLAKTGGIQGFGYLIPQSAPLSQNPERALGVIFDSDITPDLHTTVPAEKLGTRLTVMLGGHYWDEWTSYPSEKEAISLARQVLQRHLDISEAPVTAVATLQQNCIPQYEVGFEDRMAKAAAGIAETWKGRLRVAGSWYTGVGVNDCIRGAHDVAAGLGEDVLGKSLLSTPGPKTGLETFQHGRPLALVRRRRAPFGSEITVMELEPRAKEMGYERAFAKVAGGRASNP